MKKKWNKDHALICLSKSVHKKNCKFLLRWNREDLVESSWAKSEVNIGKAPNHERIENKGKTGKTVLAVWWTQMIEERRWENEV